jgi:hypothetical protein
MAIFNSYDKLPEGSPPITGVNQPTGWGEPPSKPACRFTDASNSGYFERKNITTKWRFRGLDSCPSAKNELGVKAG